MRRIVVLTIEGLGTNLVGCYGAAVALTKNWDRFATHCAVFDQLWADSGSPLNVLESLWTGTHVFERDCRHELNSVGCTELLKSVLLVTDSIPLSESSISDQIGELLLIGALDTRDEASPMDAPEKPEPLNHQSEVEPETRIARLIEAAIGKWMMELQELPVLWIHSTGLHHDWDAPYRFRCVMCDEGDPEPPQDTAPANLKVESDTDPDSVFGMVCSAGGQAIAMDEAWDLIESALENLEIRSDCLVILMGTSGYPLGEHNWVGGPEQLYAETVHLPLMIRPGDELPLGLRVPSIIQPDTVLSLLQLWIAPQAAEPLPGDSSPHDWTTSMLREIESSSRLQVAYTLGKNEQHLVVPAWSCRWSSDANSVESVEVYVMPDDRWQQNEISRRVRDVETQLENCRDHWMDWKSGRIETPPELSSDLIGLFR